ncbi:MAG: hypothetical protein GEU95_12865 [Rhizobiales bacterium]|nr:hypothetical protein [Hyphomicrobiales bacterium]
MLIIQLILACVLFCVATVAWVAGVWGGLKFLSQLQQSWQTALWKPYSVADVFQALNPLGLGIESLSGLGGQHIYNWFLDQSGVAFLVGVAVVSFFMYEKLSEWADMLAARRQEGAAQSERRQH